MHKINDSKSWFFEEINKIDFPLAQLIKKRSGEGGDTNQQVQRQKENVTSDTSDTELLATIISKYMTTNYKQIYDNESEDLEEMGRFLET